MFYGSGWNSLRKSSMQQTKQRNFKPSNIQLGAGACELESDVSSEGERQFGDWKVCDTLCANFEPNSFWTGAFHAD